MIGLLRVETEVAPGDQTAGGGLGIVVEHRDHVVGPTEVVHLQVPDRLANVVRPEEVERADIYGGVDPPQHLHARSGQVGHPVAGHQRLPAQPLDR